MLPIHTILHPTDFSTRSEHAFQLAEALARDYGAELIILHVNEPPIVAYTEGVVPPFPQDQLEKVRERLEEVRPKDPKVRVHRVLAEGGPAEEILRVARERKADLILMGTHGRTGLNRLVMGSVAEQVVRKAPCPVLTVKMPAAEAKMSVTTVPEQAGQPLGIS